MFDNIKNLIHNNSEEMSEYNKSRKAGWKSKVQEIVSFEDDKYLLETIVDREDNNTPKLFLYDKETEGFEIEKKLDFNGEKYEAISRNNSLVQNGTLLFCSNFAEGYLWNKQELLKYIKKFIYKYVDCSEEFLVIICNYVLLTYFYKDYQVLPYLRVIWDYGSWKSQLLNTIWKICYNPMCLNGSASLATTFRIMEMVKGTLVYDEADMKGSDTTHEFIKILNNGYQKWMSVLRSEWDDFNPRSFNVFWPKIIGGRMEFQDKATESRCLTEIMKPTKRQDIKKIDNDFYKEAEHIRNMCFAYKLDNIWKNIFDNSYILEWLEPRIKQILEPLLSVVDDKDEAEMIIQKMHTFQNALISDRQYSLDGIVFKIIKDCMERGGDKVHIKSIADEINLNDEYYFRNITPRGIWSLLRQNGFSTSRDSTGMFIDFNSNKQLLENIFERYSY